MEELQVKFVVTNKKVYIGVMEVTDNITSIFGLNAVNTFTKSIIMDNSLNKELEKYILGDNLYLRLIPESTDPAPELVVEAVSSSTVRLRLKIPTRANMDRNGLKKVGSMPISTIITNIFYPTLYDRMDQREVKELVALILSQFNLCDNKIGAYPNVSMGFSVIISNFEYDDGVLPEEFPNNEYEL